MTNRADIGYRVMVVEDDREMRDSLAHLLTKAGWQVETLNRGEAVARRLEDTSPDVILSDVRMPGMSGLDLLRSLAGTLAPPVVLVSAHGDIPMAVKAMQDGAYSFLEKPFDPHRLLNVLRHGARQHRQTLETTRLKTRLARLSGLDRILLGESSGIKALREDVFALADIDAPVMLLGETGTGKELVARALHDLGPRAGGPFVPVNCAAIPLEHFEASMFGIADGAPGTLSNADGGTLFLDEIGACPVELQAKLLRAIETQEFTLLGGATPSRVNIRVLSASNEKLDEAVVDARFRQDLLFRLNTMVLTLAPLRDRREDIPLLYAHFLEQQAALYEIQAPETGVDDIAALMSHDWPGNVRELRNVTERRVLAARRGHGTVAEAIRRDGEPLEV
ncbi:MAG: sigma-54-dependent transcriptional regulator, partial [Hyphomicrobiales bacterium]